MTQSSSCIFLQLFNPNIHDASCCRFDEANLLYSALYDIASEISLHKYCMSIFIRHNWYRLGDEPNTFTYRQTEHIIPHVKIRYCIYIHKSILYPCDWYNIVDAFWEWYRLQWCKIIMQKADRTRMQGQWNMKKKFIVFGYVLHINASQYDDTLSTFTWLSRLK